jgi:EAL domain-containing protein (putative c-di-GMP-specific phosphodiesterase class I)
MIEKKKYEAKLGNMLVSALKNKEFFMTYQPVFDIRTKKIIGMEALIRWLHPEMGIILPETFIPIAESSDLINKIGKWVLKEVCAQISIWQKAGFYGLKYSINVSPRQLLQNIFPKEIERIIDSNGLLPAIFEIEITETILMNQLNLSEEVLRGIHKIGVKISIDDFGTGYSSLVHLKQFPISSLKIDKSFIRDITTDPNDAIIVSTLIALSKKLGLNIIAEGIENAEQLQFLIDNDCILGQGYYLSYPLSVKEMTALLKRSQL